MSTTAAPSPDDPPRLLELQHSDHPERAAYVPSHLADYEIRALIADAHPELEQAHQVHRRADEIVHGYRDRHHGGWVIVFERAEGQSTVKESGGPLWDRIVSLVSMWQAAGCPVDHRLMLAHVPQPETHDTKTWIYRPRR